MKQFAGSILGRWLLVAESWYWLRQLIADN